MNHTCALCSYWLTTETTLSLSLSVCVCVCVFTGGVQIALGRNGGGGDDNGNNGAATSSSSSSSADKKQAVAASLAVSKASSILKQGLADTEADGLEAVLGDPIKAENFREFAALQLEEAVMATVLPPISGKAQTSIGTFEYTIRHVSKHTLDQRRSR